MCIGCASRVTIPIIGLQWEILSGSLLATLETTLEGFALAVIGVAVYGVQTTLVLVAVGLAALALTAVLANLPTETLEDYGINRNYLLGVLACGIILGLFFYLRFFFFLDRFCAFAVRVVGAGGVARVAAEPLGSALDVDAGGTLGVTFAVVSLAVASTALARLPSRGRRSGEPCSSLSFFASAVARCAWAPSESSPW